MAITSVQTYGKGIVNIATGNYIDTGTVAAFTITLGFQPRYVRIVNEDGDAFMEWFEGMADDEAMKMVGDTTPNVYQKITSGGITPLSYGFTVGVDTDVFVTSQQLSWIAFG